MQGEQDDAPEPETDAPTTVEEPETDEPGTEPDEASEEPETASVEPSAASDEDDDDAEASEDAPDDEDDEDAADAADELDDEPDPDPDADIDLPEGSDDEDEPALELDDADDYEPWTAPERKHRGAKRLIGLVALAVPAVVVGTTLANMPGIGKPAPTDEKWAGSLRYDGAGDPLLRAPGLSVGKVGGHEWKICDDTCGRVEATSETFKPGEVAKGRRIQYAVTGTGGTGVLKSPAWEGRLESTSAPKLVGAPTVGSTVSAEPGTWTGGWTNGSSLIGLRACQNAEGSKCVAFTASVFDEDAEAERTIPAAFKGWWIGAVEWRLPPLRGVRAEIQSDPATPKAALAAPAPSVAVAVSRLVGPIR